LTRLEPQELRVVPHLARLDPQFRHIHSSLMSDLGVPVKIAQEQLGHASISTTLNIYTHTIAASHPDAVIAVEGRLFSNVLESPDGLKSADQVNGGDTAT